MSHFMRSARHRQTCRVFLFLCWWATVGWATAATEQLSWISDKIKVFKVQSTAWNGGSGRPCPVWHVSASSVHIWRKWSIWRGQKATEGSFLTTTRRPLSHWLMFPLMKAHQQENPEERGAWVAALDGEGWEPSAVDRDEQQQTRNTWCVWTTPPERFFSGNYFLQQNAITCSLRYQDGHDGQSGHTRDY